MANTETAVAIEQRHEVPGAAMEAGHDDCIGAELDMARGMMRVLLDKYPGYRWYAMADFRQGVCAVSIPALMGPSQVYVIKIADVQSPNDLMKAVREAGGHILERLRLRRGIVNVGEFAGVRARHRIIKPLGFIPE